MPSPKERSSRIARIFRNWLVATSAPTFSRKSGEYRLRIEAGEITFLSGDENTFRSGDYEDARQNDYLTDVEAAMMKLRRVMRVLVQLNPPASLGGVSTRYPLPTINLDSGPIAFDILENVAHTLEVQGVLNGPHVFPPREMTERFELRNLDVFDERFLVTLETSLTEFLNVRLRTDQDEVNVAVAQSLGAAAATPGSLTPAPYLPFAVHAHTRNVDIEYAPAYFLTWTYFGGPTTPVDGWMLPGLYRFKSRDLQGKYKFDPTKYTVNSKHTYARTSL